MVYYNEHDKFNVEWLKHLMAAGVIAPGEIDGRDIQDVQPGDIAGFSQCHFFAGIGVWSYALRCAGWPDEKRVWTGSCPCQPFSVSGKRAGASDERHLWPEFFRLIEVENPVTVFGEQVASDDGLAWLDLVSSGLEGQGYTVGAVDTCAAGFGGPLLSQRLFFVAVDSSNRTRSHQARECDGRSPLLAPRLEQSGGIGDLGASKGNGWIRRQNHKNEGRGECSPGQASAVGVMGSPDGARSQPRNQTSARNRHGHSTITAGFWANPGWIYCIDEKYRPVEPGTFPLAHGIANRVGKLRGYGNALCGPQAEAFIRAYMEIAA